MRGPAQVASYIGMGLAVLGLAMIGLGWNGAAGLDRVPGQFPYLLSGGVTGLGLVVTGMAVVGVQALRTISAERGRKMARINALMGEVVTLLGGTMPELEPEIVATPRLRGTATVEAIPEAHPDITEHFDEPELAWGPDAEADDEVEIYEDDFEAAVYVISGRTSYHLPECHLVADRGDLEILESADAAGLGLSPCRICKP